MIIKFKDGSVRQVPFNPELAARLIDKGHCIDHDPGTSPEQQKKETDAVQKFYDWLQDCERCKGYIVS
jgi:hypothetical protein